MEMVGYAYSGCVKVSFGEIIITETLSVTAEGVHCFVGRFAFFESVQR